MGNKLTLNDVGNLQNESSVVTTLAQNNRAIEAAIEDTVSRSGVAPNTMQNNLDMNSKRIINLPPPIGDTEPVRKIELDGVIGGTIPSIVVGATTTLPPSSPATVTNSGSAYALVLDFGIPGGGDMFKSDNLSGLADTALSRSNIGLGNVDNTSDSSKNSASVTLTNKTINLGSNSLSGTTSQFNTALSDNDFATLAGAETLTNKTIDAANNTLSNIPASTVTYSNTTSGLTATQVQAAIDELKTLIGAGGSVGFNDSYVDAENAFWAMTICPVLASNYSNCGLWNPINSTKMIRVDQVNAALDGTTVNNGADLRVIPFKLATNDTNVPYNKKPNGRSSAASCVYENGTSPPGRPAQEIWLGRKDEDHIYPFNPAFQLPPGYCVFVGSADQAVAMISSWQFREEAYTETYISQATGTAVSDMTNPANAFDNNQTTFANLVGSSFYIGKDWGVGVTKKISRFRLTSPDGRSFSGANPARVYTWFLEGSSNGSSWTQIDTGSYSETGTGATKDYLDRTTTALSTAYRYHRVRMVDGTGSATHDVAEVEFWER